MKVSREKVAENRGKIVEAAGRLFRRSGPETVSVADVTREAGLTHGGFYGHFESKEALFGAAAKAALLEGADRIAAAGRAGGAAAWPQIVRGYLSPRHLDDCEHGCTIASLAGDVSRRPAAVQEAFAAGLAEYLTAVESVTGDRNQALVDTATMVGSLVMARAVKEGDPALRDEILATAKASLLSG